MKGQDPHHLLTDEVALSLNQPRTVGPYHLLAKLPGANSVVYRAMAKDGTQVVIKVIPVVLSAHEEARRRFRHEVEAAERIDGLCIAKPIAYDLDEDVPWVAWEYVPGLSLDQHLRYVGTLTDRHLHAFAVGLTEAVVAAHRRDIVHRDIKPGNVILGVDRPRLIDFGIALGPDFTRQTRGWVGTVSYMAQERFNEDAPESFEKASDVFALGCVIYEAATSSPPFGRAGLNDAAAHVLRTLRQKPDVSRLPSALQPVVERMLLPEPGARPTANEALIDLLGGRLRATTPAATLMREVRTALDTGWETPPQPAPDTAESAPAPATPKASPGPPFGSIVVGATIAALLLLVGVIFLVRDLDTGTDPRAPETAPSDSSKQQAGQSTQAEGDSPDEPGGKAPGTVQWSPSPDVHDVVPSVALQELVENRSRAVGLRVLAACTCPTPFGLDQLKVKLRVENNARFPIDIAVRDDSHLVALLTQRPRNWRSLWGAHVSPRRITVERTRDGKTHRQRLWAIPPNPDGAFEPLPDEPGFATFATHWPTSMVLAPGESYVDRRVKEGDLVYYIPRAMTYRQAKFHVRFVEELTKRTRGRTAKRADQVLRSLRRSNGGLYGPEQRLVGIAFVTETESVLGLSFADRWGGRTGEFSSDPNSF